jgi:CreA protein
MPATLKGHETPLTVSRFYDPDKNVLVYLVWSTKLIDGSPFNSVTAIPLAQ